MALRKMNYSQYQLNIFDEVEHGTSNIAINAVAGSGKTTTIVAACKRLHKPSNRVCFLAFNKLIADELKEKLYGYAEVSTLHAFGFNVLKSIYNMPRYHHFIKVDSWKIQKYVRENIFHLSSLITPLTDNIKIFLFSLNVQKIYDLARVNLIQSGNIPMLRTLCDEHNINTLYDEINVVDILLTDAYKMPHNLVIDYVDMIVLPLFHVEHIPHYDYVFIDECQDLNRAQRKLMLNAAKGGRFIAVGDRNQAINGFCGADCNSFDNIANIDNTIELPLSVNYRCGTKMLDLAREIVPQIKAHDGAISGEVSHVNCLTKSLFQRNDMILCRTSAPLVGLCMKLIENGITAIVKGKDIAQSLKTLIDNANTHSIESVLSYLQNERSKMVSIIMAERKCKKDEAKKSLKYQKLDDNCKCIENICLYHIKDTFELKSYIDRLFNDESIKNAITLSTVHKAKGLEANRVIILLPNKLPMEYPNQKNWQLEQEKNLKYVAVTRAKKELIFVDMTENELLSANIA